MTVRRGIAGIGACAILALLLMARRAPTPEPVAEKPAAAARAAPRAARVDLGESRSASGAELLRVVVPRAPDALLTSPCRAWRVSASYDLAEEAVPSSAVSAYALDVATRRARVIVPPARIRDVLTAVGLRPADLGSWVAPLSPWSSYALLRVDEEWHMRDWVEAYRGAGERFAQEHGTTPDASTDPAAIAAYRAELARARIREPATVILAEELAGSEDLQLRSLAAAELSDARALSVALAEDFLFAADTPEPMRSLALNRWCADRSRPGERRAAALEHLREVVRTTGDGELAVRLGLFGLQQAWDDGRRDDAAAWLDTVEDAEARCRVSGVYGEIAADPRLAGDPAELPPDLQVEQFRAIVETIAAAQAEPTEVVVSCDRVPCAARFTRATHRGRRDELRPMLMAAWPGRQIGIFGQGTDVTNWLGVVAVPDEGWTPLELKRLAAWRSALPEWFSCLGPEAWEALLGEVAEPLGREPENWRIALRSAVLTCHREVGTGPVTEELSSAGRWSKADGWRFDGPESVLRCVEERVWGPVPPEGQEIALEITPGGQT